MKNKMLFKNHTTYSKENYNKFVQFHNKKYGLMYDLYTIIILLFIIYCLITSIRNKVLFLSIIFISAILVFLIYRIFHPIFEYKKEVSSKQISQEQSFFFYFYEKSFKVREKARFIKIRYFRVYKVYETEYFFYFYMSKKHAFLIDKQGFTLGNSEDFSNFIKHKFKLKYHLELEK